MEQANATYDLSACLAGNTYPGRGIVIGLSSDGKQALTAYFIMGRSENSRNRIFERCADGMRTRAFDESKLTDPSLIIYYPYRPFGNRDIITNGDQTDTIFEAMKKSPESPSAFEEALMTRTFEPDPPHFTPRVSGLCEYDFARQSFTYRLSILKSADGRPEASRRFFFRYEPEAGIGHFIHTYQGDGLPLPSFAGEPEEVSLPATAEELAEQMWESLNEANKVSLFVRAVPLCGGEPTEIIRNKHS